MAAPWKMLRKMNAGSSKCGLLPFILSKMENVPSICAALLKKIILCSYSNIISDKTYPTTINQNIIYIAIF